MVDTGGSGLQPRLHVPLPHMKQSVVINDEQDAMFNYELVHSSYLEACKDFFTKPFSITGPWTQKARKDIISFIKSKNIVMMDLVYNLEPSVLTMYQIVLDEGVEKLVLTGTSIEVLPYEESFDIFVELHRKTGHAGSDVMLAKLMNKFDVSVACLEIFIINCNICKKLRLDSMTPIAFNDRVVIEILKAPIQDIKCRFILFYLDKATDYMLFRPLVTMDEYELSLEMLKIFTDYGPPLLIESMHAALLSNVLSILERGGFKYDTSIHEINRVVIGKSYILMEQIVKRSNPDSTNWATTCRLVQYKYNNGQQNVHDAIFNNIHTTTKPFQKLFRTKCSAKYEPETERQPSTQNKEDPSNTVVLNEARNVEDPMIEDCVVLSSETESNSEKDEIMDTMEIGEKLPLNSQELSNNLNEVKYLNTDIDMQTSLAVKIDIEEYDTTQTCYAASSCIIKLESPDQFSDTPEIEKIDTLEENELKVEYEAINICESSASQVITTLNSEDVPIKEALIDIDESPIAVDSTIIDEVLPNCILGTVSVVDKSTQTNSSIHTVQTNRKTMKTNIDNKDRYCSACKGKIITKYFCFGCKKETHIFCMTRVSNEVQNIQDIVTSFTYCDLCMKYINSGMSK